MAGDDDRAGPTVDDTAGTAGNERLAAAGAAAAFEWGLCSDPGDVRPHNEDYAGAFVPGGDEVAWDRGAVFCVADGLGGHAAGEEASRLAVETLLRSWGDESADPPAQALRKGVRAANAAILDAALHSRRRGMGTTLTALSLAGREALIAHVGDSRAYLVRDDECLQLTTDHTRVSEMLRMRLITPEQAAHHPARSMLTRSLGDQLTVQVDLVRQGIDTDDAFVLCSDGLWDIVGRHEMAAVVNAEPRPPLGEAVQRLVRMAVQRGATDNVTAVAVRVTAASHIPAAAARRSLFRRGRR